MTESSLDRIELLRQIDFGADPDDRTTWRIDGRPLSKRELLLLTALTKAEAQAAAAISLTEADYSGEIADAAERAAEILEPYPGLTLTDAMPLIKIDEQIRELIGPLLPDLPPDATNAEIVRLLDGLSPEDESRLHHLMIERQVINADQRIREAQSLGIALPADLLSDLQRTELDRISDLLRYWKSL